MPALIHSRLVLECRIPMGIVAKDINSQRGPLFEERTRRQDFDFDRDDLTRLYGLGSEVRVP